MPPCIVRPPANEVMALAEENTVHVLVADDNPVNQHVIRNILESKGFKVDTAGDGKEAILALESGPYDLVILDCLMPVMDGFTAARTIRNSESGRFDPDIPILAITSLSSEDDRSKCLEAGMSDCVSKPVAAEELFERLSTLLPEGGAQEAPAAASTGIPDIMQSLSHIVLRDAEAWREELERLAAAQSVPELGELAHKIRGTADVLAKPELSRLCRELESAAKSGELDPSSDLPGLIITQLTELIAEIRS